MWPEVHLQEAAKEPDGPGHAIQGMTRRGALEPWGRIDAGSDVKALGNTAATEWFGLSALPHDGDFAHDGWAIDALEALACPRDEAIRIRSVVE
jgi:hypothetical protein